MIQLFSVLGALIVLAAYVANQLRWIGPVNLSYAMLNFFGTGILAIVALLEQQWGFLLLEGIWAFISLWAAARLVRISKPSGAKLSLIVPKPDRPDPTLGHPSPPLGRISPGEKDQP